MNTIFSLLITALVVGMLAGGAAVLFWRRAGRHAGRLTSVHSSIQQLKAIGQLSVFKVLTKEIVTEIKGARIENRSLVAVRVSASL